MSDAKGGGRGPRLPTGTFSHRCVRPRTPPHKHPGGRDLTRTHRDSTDPKAPLRPRPTMSGTVCPSLSEPLPDVEWTQSLDQPGRRRDDWRRRTQGSTGARQVGEWVGPLNRVGGSWGGCAASRHPREGPRPQVCEGTVPSNPQSDIAPRLSYTGPPSRSDSGPLGTRTHYSQHFFIDILGVIVVADSKCLRSATRSEREAPPRPHPDSVLRNRRVKTQVSPRALDPRGPAFPVFGSP